MQPPTTSREYGPCGVDDVGSLLVAVNVVVGGYVTEVVELEGIVTELVVDDDVTDVVSEVEVDRVVRVLLVDVVLPVLDDVVLVDVVAWEVLSTKLPW